jgi:hypothetical protein
LSAALYGSLPALNPSKGTMRGAHMESQVLYVVALITR